MSDILETNDHQKELENLFKYNLRAASFISFNNIDVTAEDGDEIVEKIKNNDFEVNNYESFLDSLHQSSRMEYLTDYTKQQLEKEFTTYKVNGYDCGFAIKNDGDITSVHNTGVKGAGIGDALIEAAKEKGGTKLDHFDGFLSELYKKHGFEEYSRDQWNDEYAPADWDYTNNGKPDVVYRKLTDKK